jgi:putative hemolysin
LGTINQALRVNVLHCSATEQSCEVAMPTANSFWIDIAGLLAILLLVAANGFFVAAEFSLVAVRRSRVTQLVAEGQRRARALSKALDHLDANLAATQLGITNSSLALGWIGEPALAHLIQPFLSALGSFAEAGSHAIAVTIAFGDNHVAYCPWRTRAEESRAPGTERTALAVVRPLALFRFLFWPAIVSLNGLGNLLLRLCGLRPGTTEEALHSPEELKLLIAASQEAGLLQQTQQELFERILRSSGDDPR